MVGPVLGRQCIGAARRRGSRLIQPKLLRALSSRTVLPLGAEREVPFHARVLAATNRDLRRMMAEGRFHPDLFHRLFGILLVVPPLSARRRDIPLLIRHFNEAELQFTSGALARLEQRRWIGNVRELEQYVRFLGSWSQAPGSMCRIWSGSALRGSQTGPGTETAQRAPMWHSTRSVPIRTRTP